MLKAAEAFCEKGLGSFLIRKELKNQRKIFSLVQCSHCKNHDRRESEMETKTMTKADLVEMLFNRMGMNKRDAKDMVDAFFDEIRAALESGRTVKLSGFGNFQLRDKAQRPGRNPKTGEEIAITARRVVTFHASQKLKEAVAKTHPSLRETNNL